MISPKTATTKAILNQLLVGLKEGEPCNYQGVLSCWDFLVLRQCLVLSEPGWKEQLDGRVVFYVYRACHHHHCLIHDVCFIKAETKLRRPSVQEANGLVNFIWGLDPDVSMGQNASEMNSQQTHKAWDIYSLHLCRLRFLNKKKYNIPQQSQQTVTFPSSPHGNCPLVECWWPAGCKSFLKRSHRSVTLCMDLIRGSQWHCRGTGIGLSQCSSLPHLDSSNNYPVKTTRECNSDGKTIASTITKQCTSATCLSAHTKCENGTKDPLRGEMAKQVKHQDVTCLAESGLKFTLVLFFWCFTLLHKWPATSCWKYSSSNCWFDGWSERMANGFWSHLTKFKRSFSSNFVNPPLNWNLVGTHLMFSPETVSWIALIETMVCLSLVRVFGETTASYKLLASVAWSDARRTPARWAGAQWMNSERCMFTNRRFYQQLRQQQMPQQQALICKLELLEQISNPAVKNGSARPSHSQLPGLWWHQSDFHSLMHSPS